MSERTVEQTHAAGPPSERTRVRRLPERGVYDRDTIDAILDEALICHLAWVQDGEPRVIPTIHARSGDTLYVHGSNASRTLRGTKGGAPVAIEVTLIDGLVLARSAFHHSMNYRSVVVYGRAREVTDPDEKFAAQRVGNHGADAQLDEGVDERLPARKVHDAVVRGPRRQLGFSSLRYTFHKNPLRGADHRFASFPILGVENRLEALQPVAFFFI